MGRQRPPVPCALPFTYWVFGRPISIRNEDDKTPKGLAAWRNKITQIVDVEIAALTKSRGYELVESRLQIHVIWLSPDASAADKPDLDNILKPFIDALNKRIIADDRQVDRILAERGDINSPPDCVVELMQEFYDDPDFNGEVTVVVLENLS